jgi:hypothetical protein
VHHPLPTDLLSGRRKQVGWVDGVFTKLGTNIHRGLLRKSVF